MNAGVVLVSCAVEAGGVCVSEASGLYWCSILAVRQ